jgi:hypothetical protein
MALTEPLATVVGPVAIWLRDRMPGTQNVTKGGGSYNWHEVLPPEKEAFLAELRTRVERGGYTVRTAATSLVPAQFHGTLLLLVVVCAKDRPAQQVTQLQPDDALYMISAPNAVASGLTVQRLR